VANLSVGDFVEISGTIYCGRDAVLPKLVQMAESEEGAEKLSMLKGAVIFHTAVSPPASAHDQQQGRDRGSIRFCPGLA